MVGYCSICSKMTPAILREISTKSLLWAISAAKAESGRNRQFLTSSLAKAFSSTAVKYSNRSASISMARSDSIGSDAPGSSRCRMT